MGPLAKTAIQTLGLFSEYIAASQDIDSVILWVGSRRARFDRSGSKGITPVATFVTLRRGFDLPRGRIYNGVSGLRPVWRLVRRRREGAAGMVPRACSREVVNLRDGMLGKAVKIRHCPATVSAFSCVR
jgi:hypothetical protein